MIFQVLIASTVLVKISAEQCTTPNNEISECKSLYSCPTIIKAIAAQEAISTEFVRLSNCGGNGSNPLVCCGSSSNFTVPKEIVVKEPIYNSSSSNLFPNKSICGYQHSDDYFRPDTKNAGINEFPWLALLLFKDAQGKFIPNIRCGGSLINARYILTAANCIVDNRRRHYYLFGVRLGDFNVESSIDCEDAVHIQECSEPSEEFKIEETVVHPNYTSPFNKLNDIALIRLNGTVAYSDYIRPICLPLPDTEAAQVGKTLQTSGWGRIGNSYRDRLVNYEDLSESMKKRLLAITYVEKKKKIKSTLIANENCNTVYHDLGVPLNITENQFCTKDTSENEEPICLGDHGGPLMFSHRLQWYQEGINSFGAVPCGKYPDIHTKVRNYMDWIQENVKP